METKDKTVLSSILTAVTSMATSLKVVREDQQAQAKRLSQLETHVATTEKTLTDLQDLMDRRLITLVDALTDETAEEEMKRLITTTATSLTREVKTNRQEMTDQLTKMNTVEALKTLVASLTTMQDNVSTLTQAMVNNASEFSSLKETSALMSARLDSVDLRLASFSAQATTEPDADLNTLNNAVKLLENLTEE